MLMRQHINIAKSQDANITTLMTMEFPNSSDATIEVDNIPNIVRREHLKVEDEQNAEVESMSLPRR